MSKVVLEIEGLSKQYRLGVIGATALKDDISRMWSGIRGRNQNRLNNKAKVWALDDVNFQVKQGEILGVIGKNGAGKSTLLKILSKVTAPTKGEVRVKGRIASLLEVGTGFHPELTGRENIFLNGAILGMNKSEIRRKLDEIIEFAGIEKYIGTPVKRYSSGMYVRLAFAVAAYLESEILIIDEVLAVGDLEFQNKCLGKMKDVVGSGRTVLFVSHNMNAINSLTTRCLYLEKGKVMLDGSTRDVVSAYFQKNATDAQGFYKNEKFVKSGNCISNIEIHTSEEKGLQFWGESIVFEFTFYITNPIEDTGFSFQIVNAENIPVCHFSPLNVSLNGAKSLGNNLYKIKCIVPKLRLFMGKYRLVTWLADNKSRMLLEHLENICEFEVSMLKMTRGNYEWKTNDCIYIEDYHFDNNN